VFDGKPGPELSKRVSDTLQICRQTRYLFPPHSSEPRYQAFLGIVARQGSFSCYDAVCTYLGPTKKCNYLDRPRGRNPGISAKAGARGLDWSFIGGVQGHVSLKIWEPRFSADGQGQNTATALAGGPSELVVGK